MNNDTFAWNDRGASDQHSSPGSPTLSPLSKNAVIANVFSIKSALVAGVVNLIADAPGQMTRSLLAVHGAAVSPALLRVLSAI